MKNSSNILSVISVSLLTIWLGVSFYGGSSIYIIKYWWLFIPIALIYLITLTKTIGEFLFNKPRKYSTSLYSHIIGLLFLTAFTLHDSELFKSEKLLSAILIDDLSSIRIELRQDNKFNTLSSGMFGFTEEFVGSYQLKGDTLIFLQRPYSNNFLPDTVLINHLDSAIYFNKLQNGKFDQTKSFINYFRIDLDKLAK